MIRWLCSILLALVFTVSLVGFMAWLVKTERQPSVLADTTLRFDVIQIEPDSAPQKRQRSLPEPPIKPFSFPELSPQPKHSQQQNLSVEGLELPILTMEQAVISMNIGKPAPVEMIQNQQAVPLYRIEPRYPSHALKYSIEGYVIMRFTINEKGEPIDIEIVEDSPKKVFNREAIKALQRWKYQPMLMNGVAVAHQGQTIKLEFKLQK